MEWPRHSFKFPTKRLNSAEVEEREKVLKLVASDPASGDVLEMKVAQKKGAIQPQSSSGEVDADVIDDGPGGAAVSGNVLNEGGPLLDQEDTTEVLATEAEERPPAFELEMTVSSGTYVRSVVHDLGISMGSAAHVVILTRIQQGRFILDTPRHPVPSSISSTIADAGSDHLAVGMEKWACVDWRILERAVVKWETDEEIEVDGDGWAEWELEILSKWPNQAELTAEE
jgi:tRNA pseudouridine55 synthase